ncbi:MAG: hypothetical protein M1837_006981 [Sclerophora amabilis]|nr:MAG: hypothetical protein M1837_006981 [Sclerophora amabilis]
MADQAHATAALLTEHFRWTPLSLLDDIINSMNALLYHAVSAVENGLLNAPPASLGFRQDTAPSTTNKKGPSSETQDTNADQNIDPEQEEALYLRAKAEIDDGVHQLETLLEATVDKNFDKLELYALRNILTVPEDVAPWVRLGHYENLNFDQTTSHPSADTPTPQSIDQQRMKLRETKKLQLALVQESARNDALIAQLRSLLTPPPDNASSSTQVRPSSTSPFAFLTSNPSAPAISVHPPSADTSTAAQQKQAPLTTTTSFALSQLPSLRALLSTLRPKLVSWSSGGVPSSRTTSTSRYPHDSNSDVRTAYVEGQVKRHLVSTRGLELDEQGAPREGEGAGAYGRKIDSNEVEDLERVVGMLKDPSR